MNHSSETDLAYVSSLKSRVKFETLANRYSPAINLVKLCIILFSKGVTIFRGRIGLTYTNFVRPMKPMLNALRPSGPYG